jgi:hypothetical protein
LTAVTLSTEIWWRACGLRKIHAQQLTNVTQTRKSNGEHAGAENSCITVDWRHISADIWWRACGHGKFMRNRWQISHKRGNLAVCNTEAVREISNRQPRMRKSLQFIFVRRWRCLHFKFAVLTNRRGAANVVCSSYSNRTQILEGLPKRSRHVVYWQVYPHILSHQSSRPHHESFIYLFIYVFNFRIQRGYGSWLIRWG